MSKGIRNGSTPAETATAVAPFEPTTVPPAGGDLAVLDQLPASRFDDKEVDKLAAGGKWLPRLMLYGSNSDAVKTERVEIGYSLVEGKDGFTHLGREVDVLCIARRPKALEMGEQVVANHNIHSAEFNRIKYRADNEKDSGCMYGPEYLVWLPALGKFATFMMGSKTSRNEAPKMQARIKQAATLKTKLYANKDYKWHGPEVIACSTPFQLPDPADLLEVATAFLNPPDTEVEPVEPAAVGGDRAR